MQIAYQEWLPAEDLREVVTAYWAVEGDGTHVPGPQILPDGHIEIVANLGDPVQLRGSAYTGMQPDRVVVGLLSSAVSMQYAGHVRTFGIRFHPARGAQFLQVAATTLVDSIAQLAAVSSSLDRSLCAVLARDVDFDLAMRARLDALLRKLAPPASFDPDVVAIVEHMMAARSPLSVAQLATERGISPRQLQRRFLATVGLAPKRFQRVTRFARAWQLATMSSRDSWAAIATDNGYADQAHLIREFRAFGAEPPAHTFTPEWYETTELTRVSGAAPGTRNP